MASQIPPRGAWQRPAGTDPRANLDPARRQLILDRAFLLIRRGDVAGARRLLAPLPRDPDVDDLHARIAAEEVRDKSVQDHLRSLRYQLHLDTSARRAWIYIVAAVAAVYGGWEIWKAGPYAAANGIGASITSQVGTGGRYSRHMVDWTRPVYFDLLYGAAFLVGGLLAILIVFRIARGAAEWEELNPSDSGYSRYGNW